MFFLILHPHFVDFLLGLKLRWRNVLGFHITSLISSYSVQVGVIFILLNQFSEDKLNLNSIIFVLYIYLLRFYYVWSIYLFKNVLSKNHVLGVCLHYFEINLERFFLCLWLSEFFWVHFG